MTKVDPPLHKEMFLNMRKYQVQNETSRLLFGRFFADCSIEWLTALFTKPPVRSYRLFPKCCQQECPQETIPPFMASGTFSSGMVVEWWNSTSQTQGTAGNCEAGSFVNSAVKPWWGFILVPLTTTSVTIWASSYKGKFIAWKRTLLLDINV